MRVLIAKEVRALLPIWLACLAGLVGAILQTRGVLHELGFIAYRFAPVVLAAHAFGHEYSYRTLTALLAQPMDRRLVYAIKLGVAAALSFMLFGLAWVADRSTLDISLPSIALSLPFFAGFATPWLTLVCRGTLAGTLLTPTVFSTTFIAATVITALARDLSMGSAQELVLEPWAFAMIAFCLVAGALGLRRFVRLEAGDGTAPQFMLPRLGGDSPRRFRPVAALVAKELHLQQLTFALAGLLVAGALTLAMMQRVVPSWVNAPAGGLFAIYSMLLSLLIGAMASAEERQLGVFEWQLLQPAARGTQWAIKVIVTMSLALVLAALLPAALLRLTVDPEAADVFRVLVVPAFFLAGAGLYLSSLTNSGTWALTLALPAGVGTMVFLSVLDNGLRAFTAQQGAGLRTPGTPVALVVLPILIVLAFLNHGAVERRKTAVAWQVAVIAMAVVATRWVVLSK